MDALPAAGAITSSREAGGACAGLELALDSGEASGDSLASVELGALAGADGMDFSAADFSAGLEELGLAASKSGFAFSSGCGGMG